MSSMNRKNISHRRKKKEMKRSSIEKGRIGNKEIRIGGMTEKTEYKVGLVEED